MKRRVDLAAALIHNPEVLFLDEPTTGLDPASAPRSGRRFGGSTMIWMTIFLTTQYLEEADALADRVGIIDHGRIIAEGTPAELKRRLAPTSTVRVNVTVAASTIAALPGVDSVEVRGDEILAATADGPGKSRRSLLLSPGRIFGCARSPCASRRSTMSSSP